MAQKKKEIGRVLSVPIEYTDRRDLLEKILTVHMGGLTSSRKDSMFSARHIPLLVYYMMNGYSNDSMHSFCNENGYALSYVHVLNTELKKMGYIYDIKKGSSRQRGLSIAITDILNYVENLEDGIYKAYLFYFVNKNGDI